MAGIAGAMPFDLSIAKPSKLIAWASNQLADSDDELVALERQRGRRPA